eukprot:2370568-Rhodomonas_salina.2
MKLLKGEGGRSKRYSQFAKKAHHNRLPQTRDEPQNAYAASRPGSPECEGLAAPPGRDASAFTMGAPLYFAGSALHACNFHRAPVMGSAWLNRGSPLSLRLRSKLPGRMQMSGGAVAEPEAPPVYVRKWLEKEVKEALQRAFGDEVLPLPSLPFLRASRQTLIPMDR